MFTCSYFAMEVVNIFTAAEETLRKVHFRISDLLA